MLTGFSLWARPFLAHKQNLHSPLLEREGRQSSFTHRRNPTHKRHPPMCPCLTSPAGLGESGTGCLNKGHRGQWPDGVCDLLVHRYVSVHFTAKRIACAWPSSHCSGMSFIILTDARDWPFTLIIFLKVGSSLKWKTAAVASSSSESEILYTAVWCKQTDTPKPENCFLPNGKHETIESTLQTQTESSFQNVTQDCLFCYTKIMLWQGIPNKYPCNKMPKHAR